MSRNLRSNSNLSQLYFLDWTGKGLRLRSKNKTADISDTNNGIAKAVDPWRADSTFLCVNPMVRDFNPRTAHERKK